MLCFRHVDGLDERWESRPRHSGRWRRRSRDPRDVPGVSPRGLEHLVEKRGRPLERLDAVLELADRVTLVLVYEQLAADALFREHAVDLLRLLQRDPR